MKQDNNDIEKMFYLIGIIPVIWIALLIAPYINGGLMEIVKMLPEKLNNPFVISWSENSVKTIFTLLIIYGIGLGVYISSKKNYRRGEEHGSAKWGDKREINKKYKQTPDSQNKLLTQNVALGLNGKKHRRNLNVLVCGRKWCR